MKKKQKIAMLKVGTIEGLASALTEFRLDMDERLDKIETRLESVENGIDEIKKKLDKFDTRISALEFKVFPDADFAARI